MSFCLISGLSKWVRQLVQHHDTYSNAMQSLVAFSQLQQSTDTVPADSQTGCCTDSSQKHQFTIDLDGEGLSQVPLPRTPVRCEKPKPDPLQNKNLPTAEPCSSTQFKTEQNGRPGEMLWSLYVLPKIKQVTIMSLIIKCRDKLNPAFIVTWNKSISDPVKGLWCVFFIVYVFVCFKKEMAI